ncbi:hypothetical protein NL492_26935, partial [Klebsiella pneumoniae]|nr:hypothetical protein [Klebsiella pneumoniae]
MSTIAEESGSYHSGSTVHIEASNSHLPLSRSPSVSSQYSYSTDSGSEIDVPPQQTQSVPLVPA